MTATLNNETLRNSKDALYSRGLLFEFKIHLLPLSFTHCSLSKTYPVSLVVIKLVSFRCHCSKLYFVSCYVFFLVAKILRTVCELLSFHYQIFIVSRVLFLSMYFTLPFVILVYELLDCTRICGAKWSEASSSAYRNGP